MTALPVTKPSMPTRIGIAAGVAVVGMGMYLLIGISADPAQATSLATPLDDAIPFWPASVYLYTWIYTVMFYPLFVVRSGALWRQVVRAYIIVLSVCLLCHYLCQVTSINLRPDVADLDPAKLTDWGVLLTFKYDPPYNLFPSLHMAVAVVATMAAWKARPLFGGLACLITFGVAVSIVTLKQHFVVDGLAGLALAGVVYVFTLRHFHAKTVPLAERAFSWRGAATYLVFHGCVYGALIVGWLLGVEV